MENIQDYIKINRTLNYGLNLNNVQKKQTIHSSVSLTVYESALTFWQGFIPLSSAIETDKSICIEMGFPSQPLPYSFVLNLTLSLAVESYVHSSIVHLEVKNAQYHKPAYINQTFKAKVIIDDVNYTSNHQKTIIKSIHYLFNDDNELIFSLERITLFPRIRNILNIPGKEKEEKPDIENTLWDKIRENCSAIPVNIHFKALNITDLVLHPMVRPIGKSENLFFATYLKNTHSMHTNYQRHNNEIVVSGGIVIAMILGVAGREFRQIMTYEIHRAFHVLPVFAEDNIAAISYIKDLHVIEENIEEITIRTIGLKNTDPEEELALAQFPLELFEVVEKPVDIIQVCSEKCDILNDRICAIVDWKLTRIK